MMDLASIEYENKQAEKRAKAEDKQPYIAVSDGDSGVRNAPYVGQYKPLGWEEIDTPFVDSSGFGGQDEPALSLAQFLTKVKKGHGYAITSSGQFQVYITEYKKLLTFDQETHVIEGDKDK